MISTYPEQLQKNKEAIQNYKEAIEKVAPDVLSACTSVNKRNGKIEAYNLPPDLNTEIHAIYEKFGTKYQETNNRFRWVFGVGMVNTSEHLGGYSIKYYGRNADKFYLYRFTQEQNNQVIESLSKAAVELEKE